ncbi:hypothetical protein Rhopal_007781-T1 [Rhodotorula paludigena]|uniref:Fe2OG dioxygenase domain-containing protein n=1 Tax=Rhodotorula paludigena TaxID=86838 RepID=A0AAV5GXI6_9BASI|nr:hypothetical protein Rhopal_007781-T1 [Rhodotorula paludigena]
MLARRAAPLLRPLHPHCRCFSSSGTTTSPHPALSVLPAYLSPTEQSLLLRHSLALLDQPARTSAAGRKRRREWLKQHQRHNPPWDPAAPPFFMADDAYAWEEGHFDGVIRRYREMLVRDGMWRDVAPPAGGGERSALDAVLDKVYALVPAPPTTTTTTTTATPPPRAPAASPPPHLIMHLLHLASTGSIAPHVDNLDAFGRTIVGVSLGGARVMRFERVSAGAGKGEREREGGEGPDRFDVLLEPGSAYIQAEPLRTHYTHAVLERAEWDGRQDRLPTDQRHS